jgi:hypothetical protein
MSWIGQIRERVVTGLDLGLVLVLLLMTVVCGAALAAVNEDGFDPSSGEVVPGGSTQTNFTVIPAPTVVSIPGVTLPGTSCLVATVSPNPAQFTVSFDLPGATCVVGPTDLTMTVVAMGSASPGNYIVTIRETGLSLGGNLIGTYEWPFVVLGATTTTTTSPTGTTTTVPGATTTVPGSTSTTSSPNSTTSTTLSSTTSSTTPSVAPTTTVTIISDQLGAPGKPGSADAGSGRSDRADPKMSGTDPDAGRQAGPGVANGEGAAPALENIAFSENLRSNLGALPEPVSDLALSPLVIAEVLFRALADNLLGFLIPLVLAAVIVVFLVWRRRRKMEDGDC